MFTKRWMTAISLIVIAGSMVLGSQLILAEGTPDTYTGCLNKGGELHELALGDEPAKKCKKKEEVVQLQAAGSAAAIDWSDVLNRPAGLDDGDDDTQLTEAQVEAFITNGSLTLAAGTTLNGEQISIGLHTTLLDWSAILNRPSGLDDGDDDTHLAEVDVEDFVTNGPLDLSVGTTLDGLVLSTGDHTTELDWSAILNRPVGLDDGDDDTQLAEIDVETFVTNGPLDLDAATTLGGLSISTGLHTTELDWTDVQNRPLGLDDGDDVGAGGDPEPGVPGSSLVPADTSLTHVDSAGSVGAHTSITIGADGLPVISYYDDLNGDLMVAHCDDAACTSATTTTIDSAGIVGYYTSITIGSDGLPVVSYMDSSNRDLKVAHCNGAACTSATITTVDSAGSVGSFTSITIGADGLPVVSYYDGLNYDLKVAHCANAACTSASLTAVDSAGWVGSYSSITIGADGLPIISYMDSSNRDLKVAHCDDAACISASLTTVDSAGSVGSFTSITIVADGLPVVSYYDGLNYDLKVAHCANAACTSASLTTVDSAGYVGEYTSITIGADGLPIISYRDYSNRDLKVAHCSNAFCVPYFRRR